MDVKFSYAVNVIMLHEGYQSDDKDDKGGLTRYGITLSYIKDNQIDVNGDGIIDINDIKAIDKNKAIDIYLKYFWERYQYDKFNALQIATKVFDMAVNMGEVTAHRLLQRTINIVSDAELKTDGILGDKTFFAANAIEPEKLREALRKRQSAYYKAIVERDPIQEKFLTGWLRRAAW